MPEPEIYCPVCIWHPTGEDLWECDCGTVWNTFWTRGTCPGCGHQWEVTQCLECRRFSPHENWYHYPAPVDEELLALLEQDSDAP